MAKAPANPKWKPARKASAGASPATAAPATAAPTATEARRERREFASAPERVDRMQAETRVLKAVHQCRPGMARGSRSELWESMGLGKVYEAAQLYLIDHLPAADVHARLRLPAAKARALDRLLDNIQEAHTSLLMAELDARAQAEQLAPIEGDIVGLGVQWLSSLIRATIGTVATIKWGEIEQNDKHTLLRLAELVADAVKAGATAQHKEAQTERIERMLRRELDDAAAKGRTSVPTDWLRALFAVEMGLERTEGSPA